MHMKRALGAVIGSVGLFVALAVPAQAYVNGDYTGSGIAIRTCSLTSCTAVGQGDHGDGAKVYCVQMGTKVNGNALWAKNTNKQTGKSGFSSDHYMSHSYVTFC